MALVHQLNLLADTRTAHDGLQAVELAVAFRPDLIILDIGLPKMNGYEACRHSQEAGLDHHLVKPIDAIKLNRLLAADKP